MDKRKLLDEIAKLKENIEGKQRRSLTIMTAHSNWAALPREHPDVVSVTRLTKSANKKYRQIAKREKELNKKAA